MKNHLKLIIAFFIVSFFYSCSSKYDKNINNHFKKFILIDDLKDFEISSINRNVGDTITVTKQKQSVILQEITSLKTENYWNNHEIESLKSIIDDITNGKKKVHNGFDSFDGSRYTLIEYGSYHDSQNEGRDQLIKRHNSYVDDFNSKIAKNNTLINAKLNEVEKLSKNQDNSIVEIRSTVNLKGYSASGQKNIKFRVRQNPDGEVLLVTKL